PKSNASDGTGILLFKASFPRKAAVFGLPQTTSGSTDPNHKRIAGYARNRCYTPAHSGGSDQAGTKNFKALGQVITGEETQGEQEGY
ncbi:MAG: hypothetical protein QGI09_10250, partial [Dehalococcoidia bacterium]|nr:hypothetical protein [Dehalococcoidia bacterium]